MDSAHAALDSVAADVTTSSEVVPLAAATPSTLRFAAVTGAGSGIGRASARALMQAGWQVALLGRRDETLRETAAFAPERALVLPTDIADEAQVAAAFDAIERRWGRLDFLFNNAGRGAPASDIDELSIETWRAVVDTNLTGSFLCARAAFGLMKRQSPRGGRIVNNGSISAHAPRPGSIAYTSTKHAITGLTRTLALDGRKHDIAAGQLDIGNAETDLTERFVHGVPQAHGGTMVEPRMDVAHAASALLYMAELPLSANVPFLTVMATKMPYIGRG